MSDAVPGQELAFVSAHRPEAVESSAQGSAQHLVPVSGTANRTAAVEGPGVHGAHLWAVAATKAGGS